MCPACLASVATMIVSVLSTGGLTAVVIKKIGPRNGAKKSILYQNPKEETWEK